MTTKEFFNALTDNPSPCIHGHVNCSYIPSGPCFDEHLSTRKLDNNADPIVEEETLSSDRWA